MNNLTISERTENFLKVNEIHLFVSPIKQWFTVEMIIMEAPNRDYFGLFKMALTMILGDNPGFIASPYIPTQRANVNLERREERKDSYILIRTCERKKGDAMQRYYTLKGPMRVSD